MNVYSVTVDAHVWDDGSWSIREGPIYVLANTYGEVEEKMKRSSTYRERKIAEVVLLGPLYTLGD